jgi:flagellin-specific chaperone FliS
MRIKRFNQLYESISQDRIKEFYDRVIKIVDFNEDEYEQGDEPSNVDLLDEVGDLMNEFGLTTQDIRDIVDAYPNDFYIDTYVKPQLDYEEEQRSKDVEFYKYVTDTLTKHGVDVTEEVVDAVMEIVNKVKR